MTRTPRSARRWRCEPARARANAIGRDGAIPWSAPEDLAFFQRETSGAAVIMGRRTWDSLPRRPLPRRMNIVVGATPVAAEFQVASVEAALELAREAGHLRIYGIGGARVYAALLPVADRLVITDVAVDVPQADTFFPVVEPSGWIERASLELRAASPRCVVREFLRRAPAGDAAALHPAARPRTSRSGSNDSPGA